MKTKIITVVNQKGGSGKTTLCMQIAGGLAKRTKVLVVDADPQGTATRWSSSASDNNPFPASVSGLSAAGEGVHREVKKFIGTYDFIIIDCPPAIDNPVPQSALVIADLAIIPVIPSPADLWATKGMVKLINLVLPINEKLKALIVPNMCQMGTNLSKDALEILHDFPIPVSQSKICQRNVYRESAAFGTTIFDLKNKASSQASEEIFLLIKEILELIENPESNLINNAA